MTSSPLTRSTTSSVGFKWTSCRVTHDAGAKEGERDKVIDRRRKPVVACMYAKEEAWE